MTDLLEGLATPSPARWPLQVGMFMELTKAGFPRTAADHHRVRIGQSNPSTG
jgi:hypothetical protein